MYLHFKNRGYYHLRITRDIILEFFSTFRFGEAVLDLDTVRALQLGRGARRCMRCREFIMGMGLHTTEEIKSAGFGAYWAGSARQIPDKRDLSAYWVGISSVGDFFGTTLSYTSIRDPMLRLCHRLIACSIAGRSQAPKKVTITDLFYLKGMDVGSVNIPYLLARYLRMFASRRKRGAMISGGEFFARLAEHFGLLTEQRLQGLTVIVRDLPTIPTPIQVPQSPPAAGPTKSLPQRVARLGEEVHRIREALGEQREVLDSMASDFSRFTTWTVIGLSRMMDHAGVRYTSYSDFWIPYVRRTGRRTDDVYTSAPQ
ncbi:hypothetical protein Tco_0508590 [Tanacetum coccineum]